MPRALWSGSLSFGLVNVPVVIVTAVRDLDLHFRQLHAKDGAPVEVQRWCSKEDVEVPYEEIDPRLRARRRRAGDRDRRGARRRSSRAGRGRSTSSSSSSWARSTPSISTTPTTCCRRARTTARRAPTGSSIEVMARTERAALGQLCHAGQGVPGHRPGTRARADALDDAVRGRGPPHQGRRGGHPEVAQADRPSSSRRRWR